MPPAKVKPQGSIAVADVLKVVSAVSNKSNKNQNAMDRFAALDSAAQASALVTIQGASDSAHDKLETVANNVTDLLVERDECIRSYAESVILAKHGTTGPGGTRYQMMAPDVMENATQTSGYTPPSQDVVYPNAPPPSDISQIAKLQLTNSKGFANSIMDTVQKAAQKAAQKAVTSTSKITDMKDDDASSSLYAVVTKDVNAQELDEAELAKSLNERSPFDSTGLQNLERQTIETAVRFFKIRWTAEYVTEVIKNQTGPEDSVTFEPAQIRLFLSQIHSPSKQDYVRGRETRGENARPVSTQETRRVYEDIEHEYTDLLYDVDPNQMAIAWQDKLKEPDFEYKALHLFSAVYEEKTSREKGATEWSYGLAHGTEIPEKTFYSLLTDRDLYEERWRAIADTCSNPTQYFLDYPLKMIENTYVDIVGEASPLTVSGLDADLEVIGNLVSQLPDSVMTELGPSGLSSLWAQTHPSLLRDSRNIGAHRALTQGTFDAEDNYPALLHILHILDVVAHRSNNTSAPRGHTLRGIYRKNVYSNNSFTTLLNLTSIPREVPAGGRSGTEYEIDEQLAEQGIVGVNAADVHLLLMPPEPERTQGEEPDPKYLRRQLDGIALEWLGGRWHEASALYRWAEPLRMGVRPSIPEWLPGPLERIASPSIPKYTKNTIYGKSGSHNRIDIAAFYVVPPDAKDGKWEYMRVDGSDDSDDSERQREQGKNIYPSTDGSNMFHQCGKIALEMIKQAKAGEGGESRSIILRKAGLAVKAGTPVKISHRNNAADKNWVWVTKPGGDQGFVDRRILKTISMNGDYHDLGFGDRVIDDRVKDFFAGKFSLGPGPARKCFYPVMLPKGTGIQSIPSWKPSGGPKEEAKLRAIIAEQTICNDVIIEKAAVALYSLALRNKDPKMEIILSGTAPSIKDLQNEVIGVINEILASLGDAAVLLNIRDSLLKILGSGSPLILPAGNTTTPILVPLSDYERSELGIDVGGDPKRAMAVLIDGTASDGALNASLPAVLARITSRWDAGGDKSTEDLLKSFGLPDVLMRMNDGFKISDKATAILDGQDIWSQAGADPTVDDEIFPVDGGERITLSKVWLVLAPGQEREQPHLLNDIFIIMHGLIGEEFLDKRTAKILEYLLRVDEEHQEQDDDDAPEVGDLTTMAVAVGENSDDLIAQASESLDMSLRTVHVSKAAFDIIYLPDLMLTHYTAEKVEFVISEAVALATAGTASITPFHDKIEAKIDEAILKWEGDGIEVPSKAACWEVINRLYPGSRPGESAIDELDKMAGHIISRMALRGASAKLMELADGEQMRSALAIRETNNEAFRKIPDSDKSSAAKTGSMKKGTPVKGVFMGGILEKMGDTGQKRKPKYEPVIRYWWPPVSRPPKSAWPGVLPQNPSRETPYLSAIPLEYLRIRADILTAIGDYYKYAPAVAANDDHMKSLNAIMDPDKAKKRSWLGRESTEWAKQAMKNEGIYEFYAAAVKSNYATVRELAVLSWRFDRPENKVPARAPARAPTRAPAPARVRAPVRAPAPAPAPAPVMKVVPAPMPTRGPDIKAVSRPQDMGLERTGVPVAPARDSRTEYQTGGASSKSKSKYTNEFIGAANQIGLPAMKYAAFSRVVEGAVNKWVELEKKREDGQRFRQGETSDVGGVQGYDGIDRDSSGYEGPEDHEDELRAQAEIDELAREQELANAREIANSARDTLKDSDTDEDLSKMNVDKIREELDILRKNKEISDRAIISLNESKMRLQINQNGLEGERRQKRDRDYELKKEHNLIILQTIKSTSEKLRKAEAAYKKELQLKLRISEDKRLSLEEEARMNMVEMKRQMTNMTNVKHTTEAQLELDQLNAAVDSHEDTGLNEMIDHHIKKRRSISKSNPIYSSVPKPEKKSEKKSVKKTDKKTDKKKTDKKKTDKKKTDKKTRSTKKSSKSESIYSGIFGL